MSSELLPVKGSPDNILALSTMEMINKGNRLPHVINLVAYPLIVALSALYNTVALAVKLPFTLFRHTFGYIPTSHGRVMDSLPNDTDAKHFLWHVYKILMSPVQLAICYPLSVFMPGANVFFQRNLCLIDDVMAPPPLPPRDDDLPPGDDDLPPPPPLPRDEDPSSTPSVGNASHGGTNRIPLNLGDINSAKKNLKKTNH
ncbi:hypothetical protein [Criblamydia sequanensis]|uniref:Membrane protein n=1 Tax=Candidatus Criblamydia sequanensis CRIB-18 TaxID=1437425 RepID=A0A090CZ76_9BACT|nr:hypothetical protein [Criblamydia sequanensis]CDR34076.1 putative membrane protein [Criblamydia sequanensis CRIB-18]